MTPSFAVVIAVHGEDVAEAVALAYPTALPLLANGWTLDAAIAHVEGTCDRMLCTGEHTATGTESGVVTVHAAEYDLFPEFYALLGIARADERDLCAWCDAPATRNLHTFHDVACDAHFAQWFGPGSAPVCDCPQCLATA
jgi:hypothetical protein